MYCTLHCTFTVYFLSLCRKYESKGFWRFSLILKRRYSNEKIQYLYCTVSCTVSTDDRTIINHAFQSKRCINNEKTCYCYTFYNENHTTYQYITCNKKLLLKIILAYCGYSPTSPLFLLLSEHKLYDNAATNSNSENARSRMVASLRGSVGTRTK